MKQQGITLDGLRRMIGHRVRYEGSVWQIIDVLEDDPGVVLEICTMNTVVQTDQYGDARRRVPQRIMVPVFDDGRHPSHPLFLALEVFDLRE